jgi:molybdopterin-guanine dinucleotide biosynthesis protein A
MPQRVGVVLAGGEGRRLGRHKQDLHVGGRPLAERAAAALWPFCGTVLISVRPGAANPAPGFHAVEDPPPAGRGPLAGIHAAFGVTAGADLLVLACDYPRVGPPLIRRLLALASDGPDLVMPTDRRGHDHPLVALWRRSTEPRIAEALSHEAHELRQLLPDWNVQRLGPDRFPGLDVDRLLLNVNWPADLEQLKKEGALD